jgi:nucleoside-diphosphate-sugar epimerase
MKSAIVLGGAGFLGSHICDALIASNYRVTAIDNLSSGSIQNIQQLLGDSKFTFVAQDICSPFSVTHDVDLVFNFASLASPPRYFLDPVGTLRAGSIGVENAIQLSLDKGARLIHASTSEVYGDPLEHPQNETYWGNVNPVGERSCYDEAKRYAEALCVAYSNTKELDVGIVRIFNTYGPRLDPNDGRVLSNLVNQALKNADLTIYGDGSQTRSFCFVSDLVRGILDFSLVRFRGPINLGNPNEITIIDLAKMIVGQTKSSSKVVYKDLPADDPQRRCPDISLAKQVLDWEPVVSLEIGLRHLIDWYSSDGVIKLWK